MKRTKITKELVELMIYHYTNTNNIVETSKILNLNSETVSNYLKKNNTIIKDFRIKNLDYENIKQLYLNSIPLKEIAKIYNCHLSTINTFLSKNNLTNTNQKYIYKNIFEDLNNRNVQYWLGILASDGYISDDNKIELGLKDEEHVIKFKDFCQINNQIRLHYKKEYKLFRYGFRNKIIANFLYNVGIKPRKSLDLKIKIPITWDLLRGLSDGDGSFSVSKNKKKYYWGICTGSILHQKDLCTFLTKNNILYTVSERKQKNVMYLIKVQRKLELFKLINLLYDNADTYLNRKYFTAQFIRNDILKTSSKFREPALGILSEINSLNQSNS